MLDSYDNGPNDKSFSFFQTMRLLSSLEILNLKQIKTLSDKFLVNFYAEMSSNEMTRNFIYTCYLMPRKCQTQFKSFGNESGARMKMRNHLHKHLEQLVDEENGKIIIMIQIHVIM